MRSDVTNPMSLGLGLARDMNNHEHHKSVTRTHQKCKDRIHSENGRVFPLILEPIKSIALQDSKTRCTIGK